MTLSGRNGAGKTTLLRMLAGEASIDVGELVLAKDVEDRAARPAPAARARAVAARLRAVRRARAGRDRGASWRRSSRRWPDGAHDEATLDRYAEAQARLEHAGGYGWRERALSDAARARVPRRRRPRPVAGDVLRRRADPRLARARAGRRPRPAAARRAHQPPRHRVARVARAAPRRARRRDRPGRARPLVPRGGRHLGARARGRPREVLRRAVARLAREKAARELALGRAIERQQAEIERLERFVDPLPRRDPGPPGPVAGQEASRRWSGSTRDPADGAALEFAFKPPERSGRVVFELERRPDRRSASSCCSTTPSCGSSAASTCRWSGPTAPARRR